MTPQARSAPYAPGHSARIASLARSVAQELGCTAAEIEQVGDLARVHDIGKTAIPAHILEKSTPLSPRELQLLRRHPKIGADLVAGIPRLAHLAPYVCSAYERWDGSGYPHGLAGNEIPRPSRIVHACDAYVALLADRPYRQGLRPRLVREVFQRNAGTQFCPTVTRALLRVVQPAPAEGGPPVEGADSRLATRVARRDPRRTATIVYALAALAGLGLAAVIALPVESVNDRCPPAGEGLVMCQVQKIGLRLSLLVLLAVTCTTAIAHFATFSAPSLYLRWRSGEFTRPDAHVPDDDPVLVAAHWGFVPQRERSRVLGRYRFDRRERARS